MSASDLFGQMPDGRPVPRLTLAAGEIEVHLIALGATLQGLYLRGLPQSLTLGLPLVADYLTPGHCAGNIVGPVANRIGGARAQIDGRSYRFEDNHEGHTLHSGAAGVQWQLWEVDHADPTAAEMTLDLPDGAGGLPGNRRLSAQFSVAAPAELTLILSAETDAPTLMNPANHSYWNLSGQPTTEGHRLKLAAEHYLPDLPDGRPTGEIAPVAGTDMDLRAGITLPGPPFDNNYCLSSEDQPLRPVAWLSAPEGPEMVMETTAPGLQIYDGRRLAIGSHGPYAGLALEAQRWPDAPNNRGFPSILLRPGETFRQITRWRFSRTPTL